MKPENIHPGDRIADPLQDNEIRTVEHVDDYHDGTGTVFFTDGGCMGTNEVKRVYLESEEI